MRINRFRGEAIHGYLRFKIDFNSDLTFLTGINGGGKTSALNSILALLGPDLGTLAALEFEHLSIDITEDNGSKLVIGAIPTDTGVELSIEGLDSFRYSRFIPDSDAPYKTEAENEYYREVISAFASHPVIRKLSSLPTPMFLGLDRRPRLWDDSRRFRYTSRGRSRNPFAGSLNTSIMGAAGLAEDRNQQAVIQSSKVLEELQEQMLLNLITPVPGESSDFIGIKVPSEGERAQLKSIRKNLASIATILRLSPRAVDTRLRPLLNKLDDLAKAIPVSATFDNIFGPDAEEQNQKYIPSIFAWTANVPHLDRIIAASEVAEQFNKLRSQAIEPIENYRKLINDFLKDSGKEIIFTEKGDIGIEIDGIDEIKSISHLSSGEAQLFVILTHLTFSDNNQSKIFIIDEPELSLHLRWQELFVDSLIAANSNVQYILATHSPSIILDKVDRCLDVSAVRGRRRVPNKK